ncbi:MAG: FixH family protein [Ignavibacteriae bacterium]|nr:FixH family protein [Ignavibacteriota bacterium]
MPDLHLSLSYHSLLLGAAAVAAFVLAWFVYRITVPPVSSRLRWLLTVVRWLALFLLILFVGEPLLSLLNRTTLPPTTMVLVDNSRSMTMKDGSGERETVLKNLVSSGNIGGIASAGAIRHALFATKARVLESFTADSLTLAGKGTDIAAALKEIKTLSATNNIQAVVLVTDGNVTVGSSPLYEAEELSLPVFTIGIGDTSEQRDVLVRKVLTNSITYVGNNVPVQVTLKSSGFNGERVEVTLNGAEGELDRKIVTLQNGTREYSVPLSMTPRQEGTQKFTVDVSRLKDELTYENNRHSFFTKVLKSKMRVALIAGAPSPDVAFVRRALESDPNIEVRTFIEREGGQLYEGALTSAILREAECLVLIGFPEAQSPASAVAAIAEAAGNGTPVFFLVSRRLDLAKLRALEPSLPFSVQGMSTDESQAFITVPDAQRNNALLKLSTSDGTDQWTQLAPVFKLQANFRAKPEAEVLATTRIQNFATAEPFLLSRNINRRKSLAILGYGIWRWTMLADNTSGSNTLLEEFLSNAVRWLTTREDDRRVRVQPVRETFGGTEPVEFAAQVYDENYRPVDNADVTVSMRQSGASGDAQDEMKLSPVGNGQYEGSLDFLNEGDYRYSATARVNGDVAGEDNGTFSVGGLNIEFLETRMNKELLQQIASRTGGAYYSPGDVASLASDIAALPGFKPRESVQSEDIELWNKSWMLGLVVGLFSLEWFVRKRNGML